jgi:hypothetical protein
MRKFGGCHENHVLHSSRFPSAGVVPARIRQALDSIGKKCPGPTKKVDDTELELNRNNLIVWLKEH